MTFLTINKIEEKFLNNYKDYLKLYQPEHLLSKLTTSVNQQFKIAGRNLALKLSIYKVLTTLMSNQILLVQTSGLYLSKKYNSKLFNKLNC